MRIGSIAIFSRPSAHTPTVRQIANKDNLQVEAGWGEARTPLPLVSHYSIYTPQISRKLFDNWIGGAKDTGDSLEIVG
ncbi:MAG: hypothetical protein HOC79_07000 [Euryarchaeota archaeon]|nr:hypothetical protein [Euryarchaeota archaeon]